jgi:hypothetical protein
MTSLDEWLDAPEAEPWKPEVGDSVQGKVLEICERQNEFNPNGYPVVTIDAGDRIVQVHGFHEVLGNELARLEVQVADRVGVKYLGRKDGNVGYHRYKVVKDGVGPSFSWDKYRPRGDDSPEADSNAAGEAPPADESQHGGDDGDIPF